MISAVAGAVTLGATIGWERDSIARSFGFISYREQAIAGAVGATTKEEYTAHLKNVAERQRVQAKRAAEQAAIDERQKQAALDAERKQREAACQRKFSCWSREFSFDGMYACQKAVQRFAKYQFRWNSEYLTSLFPLVIPGEDKTIIFSGSEVAFQNGFGAWQPHSYSCVYSTKFTRIVDLDVRPGRLFK